MRGYNYRKEKQEKFVKRRIMNISFHRSYQYINYNRRSMWGHYMYSPDNPEDLWFNYLGEYTRLYKSSPGLNNRKYYKDWNDLWKEKYLTKRANFKKITKRKVNDQVGERYYVFNK